MYTILRSVGGGSWTCPNVEDNDWPDVPTAEKVARIMYGNEGTIIVRTKDLPQYGLNPLDQYRDRAKQVGAVFMCEVCDSGSKVGEVYFNRNREKVAFFAKFPGKPEKFGQITLPLALHPSHGNLSLHLIP